MLEDLVTKEYTIKLHGSYLSTCSQRVLVVAKEKELEVDMHVVNTAAVSLEMRHITLPMMHRIDFDNDTTERAQDSGVLTDVQSLWPDSRTRAGR